MLKTAMPDVIIHTAAMSKPDECDRERALCTDINVNGTKNLIEATKALNKPVHFINISTDFVLGENGPHDEDANPAPLNFYGETKLAAEKIVAESGLLNTIVRVVFLYGETWEGMRPTFLHWVKQRLEKKERIRIVADQHRTPTYVGDVCNAIKSIIEKKAEGLYHIAGDEVLTPYDMAVAFAKTAGLDAALIEAVTADTFPEPVQRAKKGGLIIKKAKDELGFRPISFTEGLKISFPQQQAIV
jgi:dTDP-4-dehydrorhamnose reductase